MPRVLILATEDKTITADFQRWMIENNLVKEVKEIKGSSDIMIIHATMFLFCCFCTMTDDLEQYFLAINL